MTMSDFASGRDWMALLQACQQISAEMTPAGLLEVALAALLAQTGAGRGAIWLSQEKNLQIAVTIGELLSLSPFQPLIDHLYQTHRPAANDHHLCLPIITPQTAILGVICLEKQASTFSDSQIEAANWLASQTAISLLSAQRYTQLQQEASDRQRAEEMLRVISAGTAAVIGSDFFHSLVRHLASVLQVNSAFITECADESKKRVRTLAFLENDQFSDNFEYNLEGTACEGVIAGSICYYAAHLQEKFYKEAGIESYLGVPIHNTAGEILGHLAIYDPKPMPEQLQPHKVAILQIFAARAGAELDRIRAYQALEQAKDELEARVMTRTAELTQEIIERQQLIVELDAFAHTVAHDLKNPLTGIMAYTELLQADWPTAGEKAMAVASIAQSSHKMSNIIKELLTLAEMRQMEEIIWQPLDMGRIVQEAQQRLGHHIEEKEAKINLPAVWPAALGYAPWVEEIWANYLSNALKYGGEPPCLTLGATIQADGLIKFWVSDNGQGIPAGEQSRLFRPFTRLDQMRATGHGLGLSIVRRIVEKLGGQVGVESRPGQGSLFYFTLQAPNDKQNL